MLIIGPSGLGKANALLNLIQKQDSKNLTGKIYFYAEDLSETKYKFLIKKREDAEIKNLDDPSALIEYSNTMDGVYDNIDDYNLKRKGKILIVFYDCTNEPYSFLTIDNTLAADNPMRFRNILLCSPS